MKRQKENKVNEINDLTTYLFNKYKNLFQDEETYNALELHIFNKLPTIIEKYKDDNSNLFQWSIISEVNNNIFSFISEEVKKGDIDLEIKIVEHFSKHANLIYSKFDDIVNSNSTPEAKEVYTKATSSDDGIKRELVNKLWEDSIIETLDKYDGEEIFSLNVFKNFKNKLLHINKEIEYNQKVKTISRT